MISGSLALISGGAASALVAPAADIIGVKVFAAGLAFASGFIALVTTAFFDEKETAKINEGAGRYGELRNRADIILNSRNRNLEQIDTIYQRLTETQTALQTEFDIYIDVETIQKKSNEILADINPRLARTEAQIRDRYRQSSTPMSIETAGSTGKAASTETVGSTEAAGSAGTARSTGIERGGPVGGGFQVGDGFRLGPAYSTNPGK